MSDNDKRMFDDSSDNIVRELRATFKDEAYELLAELENALLELEKDPGDGQQVSRVFRAMHTIKGSGGACEFHEIAAFTHELETIFEKVRSGKVSVTKEIINLTLSARDVIEAMFNAYYRGGSFDQAGAADILASFKKLLPDAAPATRKSAPVPDKLSPKKKGMSKYMTYRIRFRPSQDIFSHGTNPVNLLNELRELGTCKIIAQTEAIPYLEDFDAQACHTYWDVILSTDQGINAIQDVFIFVKDSAEVKIDIIDQDGYLEEKTYKKLGEILLERGDLAPEDLQKALNTKKRVAEVLVESGVVPSSKVESALVEQQHVREMREQRRSVDAAASIRVATGKLDGLVNLVGELVTVQARLTQTALTHNIPGLVSIAEEVERLTADLRDKTMSVRMLPIGTTFSNFRRLFRDLSRDLGKEVELVTEGGETELDKNVIERLNDPMVHIIRNSLDHGLEPPDVRLDAGKPRKGTVRLAAVHSGAYVLIQISDDGAGMDRDAIRAKGIEKGVIDANVELTDSQLYGLIFTPGFSTAKKITSVSGRGVGLDVVKKAIDDLRGTIEISSEKGKGTMITLKLPLTLAIIDGLLVMIEEQRYVLPLSYVKECVELNRNGREESHGRNIANVRGEIVPYIILREQFGIKEKSPDREQIVITEVGGLRVGFVVDHVIGGHQTVIKNLGRYYQGVEGLAGATILGDGTVALILDVPKLVHIVEREETNV